MTAACGYTHKICRCKLGGVKKRLVRFCSPMTENIVSTNPRVQHLLMVLNIAETNKVWKIESN